MTHGNRSFHHFVSSFEKKQRLSIEQMERECLLFAGYIRSFSFFLSYVLPLEWTNLYFVAPSSVSSSLQINAQNLSKLFIDVDKNQDEGLAMLKAMEDPNCSDVEH